MNKKFGLIFLLLCSGYVEAQETPDYPIFRWEEVVNAHPDTVYGISFERMKLTELPDDLQKFTSLKSLILTKNKLSALPDYLDQMDSLYHLDVGKNQLTYFPIVLCRMQQLKRLQLNRNPFERLPECLGNIEALEYLDLYDTPIRDFPSSLEQMKNIKEIDLTGIRFSPRFQEAWTNRLPSVKLIFDAPCDCME